MHTGKKTVALTGSSGTMGFRGFLELYAHGTDSLSKSLGLSLPGLVLPSLHASLWPYGSLPLASV